MALDNVVRICDKMQVIYMEMAYDGAKSNVAKWNLISRIQFNHVKNCLCLMFLKSNDWLCSDWTLDIVSTERDGM